MILVDTAVWIEHLRAADPALSGLLERGAVLGHPWVTGELALGSLKRRGEVIGLLEALPQAVIATPRELLGLIGDAGLSGTGVGYVDAQLLAATRLTLGSRLWTSDRRLAANAERLGVAFSPRAD